MKLIYRIALRLSLVLLPLLALWAVLFYAAMVDEINDEADDALEDYSELIVTRMLAGRALPSLNSGSNNSYSIAPVDEAYASEHPRIVYYDAEVFIPEKDETEPARILTTVFQDRDGNYFELKVATPTFEKDDLLETILGWVVSLYFLLLVTIVGVTVWVLHRSMRPLYALLRWLDGYVPGRNNPPVPDDTNISEFRRLNEAAPTVPTSCSIGRSSLSAMPLMSCRRLWPCSETGSNGCWTGPSSRKSKWASCSRCNGRWAASYGSTEPCCF
jgi:two-component system sensor histidine kinase QseC